jgi:HlyD family secretion protein
VNRKLASVTVSLVLAAAAAAVPALMHRPAAARDRASESTVSASGTVCMVAHDLAGLRVKASVKAADIGRVRAGQPVRFTVDAYPGRTFEGTVHEVRLRFTTTAGMAGGTVVIRTRDEALRLRPGMTADVRIRIATRGRSPRVRTAAPRVSRTDPGAAVAAVAPPCAGVHRRHRTQVPQTPASSATDRS